ncbi:MAG: hypothetical protein ACPGXY_04685 [Alphaproteobacteria bacterium]
MQWFLAILMCVALANPGDCSTIVFSEKRGTGNEEYVPKTPINKVVSPSIAARAFFESGKAKYEWKDLEEFVGLKTLCILNKSFGDDHIRILEELSSLTVLTLDRTSITSLKQLPEMLGMRAFSFNQTAVTSLEGIEQCRNLLRIDISALKLESLEKLKELEELRVILAYQLGSDIDWSVLAKMPKLQKVIVESDCQNKTLGALGKKVIKDSSHTISWDHSDFPKNNWCYY